MGAPFAMTKPKLLEDEEEPPTEGCCAPIEGYVRVEIPAKADGYPAFCKSAPAPAVELRAKLLPDAETNAEPV